MRIDRFLWFVRVVKTRGLAQQLVGAGHLRIDGRPAVRAATEVRVGSVITFAMNDRVRVLRIEALPSQRGSAPEAQACYTDLSSATG